MLDFAKKTILWFIVILHCSNYSLAQNAIITYGSSWKYLDNGSNQGSEWVSPSFVDTNWKQGVGLFGYGRGGEATVVSYGTDKNNRYVTTYFRKSFTVDTAQFTGYTINIKRDDGVVVYINGSEVFRTNMPPTGTITYILLLQVPQITALCNLKY